ncbi:MAG: hypothetical protein G01um1014107_106 [Parcubacteria group bacterium Gr01-1014_107]|nr:MAG: hypothetical protein G01um1014107_106 [Parcubacteria group bacterium Gr01-1014_107]
MTKSSIKQIKEPLIIITILISLFFILQGGEALAKQHENDVPLPGQCLTPMPQRPTIIVQSAGSPILDELDAVKALKAVFPQYPVPLGFNGQPNHLIFYQIQVLNYNNYTDDSSLNINYTHPTGKKYEVQAANWINSSPGGPYQASWWMNLCWNLFPQFPRYMQCNPKFLKLPQSNSACLQALDKCWVRYFTGVGDPDCPKAPPGSPAYPGPYSPPFPPGTVIPPTGEGSDWDINDPPYGGYITGGYPCLCSMTWKVFISPPGIPAVLGHIMGMPQFPVGAMPWPGRWVLGWFTGGQSCVQWGGLDCFIDPVMGIPTPFTGTSAF